MTLIQFRMTRIVSLAIVVLTILSVPLYGQDGFVLQAGDLEGATLLKTEAYAGKALFGYIDGGAELYLEYGFKILKRQEVEFAGEKFVIENYQMAGPNEAYGIFSVQRFKCLPLDSLLPNTCLSKYQLQAVVGDCYLNIINESGSDAAQHGSVALFRALIKKIKPQHVQPPPLFSDMIFKPDLRNMIVICGPLGLQNGLSDWSTFFEGFDSYTIFALPVERGPHNLLLAYVHFTCCVDIEPLCVSMGFDGKKLSELQTVTKSGTVWFARQLGKQILVLGEASEYFPGIAEYMRLVAK